MFGRATAWKLVALALLAWPAHAARTQTNAKLGTPIATLGTPIFKVDDASKPGKSGFVVWEMRGGSGYVLWEMLPPSQASWLPNLPGESPNGLPVFSAAPYAPLGYAGRSGVFPREVQQDEHFIPVED